MYYHSGEFIKLSKIDGGKEINLLPYTGYASRMIGDCSAASIGNFAATIVVGKPYLHPTVMKEGALLFCYYMCFVLPSENDGWEGWEDESYRNKFLWTYREQYNTHMVMLHETLYKLSADVDDMQGLGWRGGAWDVTVYSMPKSTAFLDAAVRQQITDLIKQWDIEAYLPLPETIEARMEEEKRDEVGDDDEW